MAFNDFFLSVIITNYNKKGLVLRAYESAESQLEEGDEIVIVDDGSSDQVDLEALDLLSKKKSKAMNVLCFIENKGVSTAKNIGISHAKNDIIVLLDADDVLPRKALESIRIAFCNNDADIVFGDYLHTSFSGEEKKVSCKDLTCGNSLDLTVLAYRWKLLGTSPFRKSTCFNLYKFDPVYNRTDDVDFHRKLLMAGKKAYYTENVIYNWIQDESGNNNNIPQKEIFLSHARSFDFFYSNLPFFKFLVFLVKFQVRLFFLTIKKCIK